MIDIDSIFIVFFRRTPLIFLISEESKWAIAAFFSFLFLISLSDAVLHTRKGRTAFCISIRSP